MFPVSFFWFVIVIKCKYATAETAPACLVQCGVLNGAQRSPTAEALACQGVSSIAAKQNSRGFRG